MRGKIITTLLLIILLTQGCSWFSEAPFHKTIILPETIIHINNDCNGDMGWAMGNEICVWGYEQDGIVIDYEILGHEIAHILHNIDSSIRNPDEIGNLPIVAGVK